MHALASTCEGKIIEIGLPVALAAYNLESKGNQAMLINK